jgi:glyoxylase-like metal-dependent hydrolase (beta-lactamase superfamily II)
VAISHTHGDHVGNIALFPSSTVLIQAAEYDWSMAGPAKPAFASTQMIKKLVGDHDVFADASVKIVSTPGHTPGHQSDFNRDQTLASLERIAALEERKAQLWINHDKPQSDRLKFAPAFYE